MNCNWTGLILDFFNPGGRDFFKLKYLRCYDACNLLHLRTFDLS